MNDEIAKYRKPDAPVLPLIIERWSPRAMTGEPLDRETIQGIFEAARWAPSSYNNQPWRFLYATHNSQKWQALFDLLMEANQAWVKDAALLILVLSAKTVNGRPQKTHHVEAGMAYQNMALQAASMGLVFHGMAGFDYEKAAQLVGNDNLSVECMIAVGKPASKERLPEQLQKAEVPSTRNPVSSFASQDPRDLK